MLSHNAFDVQEDSIPLCQPVDVEGSGENLLFGSRDIRSLAETDSELIMENDAEPIHVWPRVLLDYMGQKYRGRTKKNPKQECAKLTDGKGREC